MLEVCALKTLSDGQGETTTVVHHDSVWSVTDVT